MKERRRSKRIPFTARADLITAGRTYKGCIKDVSEEGIGYILSTVPDVADDFVPDNIVDLVLNDPSGKLYTLNCELKWYSRGKGKDRSMTLGMKVIDQPPKYKELIETLITTHEC